MSQLAHTQDPAVALEGMEADCSFAKERISALAAVAVNFGHGVVADDTGDAPFTAVLPTTTGEITDGHWLGVAVSDVSIEATTAGGYAVNDTMPVLRKGRVWVITEDAVTAIGTPAFCRFAAGSFAVLGAFRTDADTATAVAVPGARFMSLAGIGELVVLELA